MVPRRLNCLWTPQITVERFGQLVLPAGGPSSTGEVGSTQRPSPRSWGPVCRLPQVPGGERSFLGVANQRVIVRQLELPSLPRAELRSSLPFQVHDLLPIPVDPCGGSTYSLRPRTHPDPCSSRTYKGLLVAAARGTVLANVAAARGGRGLRVEAIST